MDRRSGCTIPQVVVVCVALTMLAAACGSGSTDAARASAKAPSKWCALAKTAAEGKAAGDDIDSQMSISERTRRLDAMKEGVEAFKALRASPPSEISEAFHTIEFGDEDSVVLSKQKAFGAADREIKAYIATQCDIEFPSVTFWRGY